MADLDAVAKDFTKYYYSTFDNSVHRGDLSRLYRDNSMLTFEGDQFLGVAPITEKLVTLAFTTVVHAITTLDAQPFPGGLVVLVTGQLKVDTEGHAIGFTQAFTLIQDGDSYYVFNDLFRLNYG